MSFDNISQKTTYYFVAVQLNGRMEYIMTNYYNGYKVNDDKKNLSILSFLKYLLKYWYIILLSAIIATSVAYVYTEFFMTPAYSSTAKLYISNKNSENITTTDFSISSQLGKDYMELMGDYVILEPVSKAIDGKYSASQIKSFLKTYNPTETRFLEVTITCPDPKDAKELVDLVCQISQDMFIEVLNADRVTIVSEGRVPNSPSSPNLFNNLITGCMAGLVCSVGLIFLVYILNDTIKHADDIEKALDLNVLATIPFSSNAKSYY